MSTLSKECKTDKPIHTAHGEAQRRALAQAAYDLIAEKGFEGLRTRDVAERAGVNIATLHYYFQTKEDLIRGVVHLLREHLSTTKAPLFQAASRNPIEELHQELADVQYQVQEIPETFKVLFELYLRSLRDPSISSILQEMQAGWQQHIEAYLTAGVRQGMFPPDLDIPAAAAGLSAFVMGRVVQTLFMPQTLPDERVSAEIARWLTDHTRANTPR